MFATAPPLAASSEQPAKKRRPQVKLACMNCRRQHAGCTDSRPCERCTRLGLASTCEDIPRRKRTRKKHLTEFDDDDDFDGSSEANSGKVKNPDLGLMNPPIAKRPRRQTTSNSTVTKKEIPRAISELDQQNALLLPPGTMTAVPPHSGQFSQAASSHSPYSLTTFDPAYLDSIALGRASFPYGTGYPTPNYPADAHHTFASLPQNYFYPPGYGMPSYSSSGSAQASSLGPLPPSTTSATATAQQQSSSSYSANLRGTMLPAASRYVSNPMASLPSFPYSPMYNHAPNWMNPYATAPQQTSTTAMPSQLSQAAPSLPPQSSQSQGQLPLQLASSAPIPSMNNSHSVAPQSRLSHKEE